MGLNQYSMPAILQLVEWARAWVDNETSIAEMPAEHLSDEQKGALLIMELLEKVRP